MKIHPEHYNPPYDITSIPLVNFKTISFGYSFLSVHLQWGMWMLQIIKKNHHKLQPSTLNQTMGNKRI